MQRLSLLIFSLILCLGWRFATAQETRFFMPKEIRQAYESGTRSYDGRPGDNYWHNTVDYTIAVEVIPSEQRLTGSETVTYYNNSPDELSSLVIRLYHDAFREANARAYRVSPDDITQGVKLTRIVVDGQEIGVEQIDDLNRNGTNMDLPLPQPLPSGAKVTFEMDWEQFIPETTIRSGAYDSTSYFVAYWYPQVAVYDDIFGWDRLSYDFSTEFYNNLGNYDVTITAPKNFTVLSTGELQNPAEVLSEPFLSRYREAQRATETTAIITVDDLADGVAYASDSWHYQASEVSDFAFCLSDHYCWDAATQKVEDRQVLIHSFYNQELAVNAAEVTDWQKKMMRHFSEDMPGIPYPYPEFCTFISGAGGGGMEYPMMANNGDPGLGVTVHEMFHTYFPMYVRTNEKRFAWMDEGWADFNTSYVVRRFFEDNTDPLFGAFGAQVSGTLGSFSDLPLITSTQFMDETNYGYASYPLPAFLYSVLLQHLGEDQFKACYREYIRRWAKKSPTPYDFIYTFENVSGQDLSWFWKPWFFSFGNVDIQLQSYKKGKLLVNNAGTRPVPLSIRVEYNKEEEEEFYYPASIWNKGDRYVTKLPRQKEITAVSVNYNVPDADPLNNYYPPLQDRYRDLELNEDITGTYALVQFPVSAYISIKDGMLFFSVPAGGIESYLIPADGEDTFDSIDGMTNISFQQEGGKYQSIIIKLKQFGFTLDGTKQ
jgi:hypothetical protein